MSNSKSLALPLVLVAALAGGGLWFAMRGGDEPAPPKVTPTVQQPEVKPPTPPPEVVRPAEAPRSQDLDRTAVKVDTASADAPQGVRGRLLLPDGRPAADVPVMLITNLTNNPIEVFLMNKTSKSTAASTAATATTAADGTFALGIRQIGKAYDLRIVSPEHPEKNVPQIKVREGDWFDTGDVRLENGLVVQGNVVEEESKLGIPNATVYLTNSAVTHSMIATPGREKGIAVVTDDKGFYRFTTAPTTGLITLTPEAAGYAGSPLPNLQLNPQGVNEFQIQMVHGQSIAGIVVDPDGKPVAGASVAANGLSQKTPQVSTTTTGSDGVFQFPALRAGPYSLVASLASYIDGRQQPVMTGDTEVKLVLGLRPTVKLRVLTANKTPVKSYRLTLMRYFPNNPTGVGKVLDFPDRSVTPGDYPSEYGGEWAAIRNVPIGDYRWQVQEGSHAKTLSPPFTVVENGPIAEVTAELTLGGIITGTVVDDRGQPVPDAIVTTDMNSGPAGDLGLLEIFSTMIPEKHTKTQGRTDAQGRFKVTKLSFADYMVRVSHPEFCEGTAVDIKLDTPGQVADAGVIKLARGAVVEGITLVAGQPAGQVKVQVSVPMPTAAPGQTGPITDPRTLGPLFHGVAISDNDGRFRLLKRVPPGNYKVTASRQTAESPFSTILDMKNTEQQLMIRAGQDRAEVKFNLPAR
ncbi:MAG: carboxypeptidase regulatory-like domain-containing protein [Planctomycetes bacterium]|nr:carboxypeptidase regulatory-like domain-containing protein [Planctomycetota bacterium]